MKAFRRNRLTLALHLILLSMPKLPQVLQNMRRTWFTMKLRNSREGDIIADYCGPWSTQLSPIERLRTTIVPKS